MKTTASAVAVAALLMFTPFHARAQQPTKSASADLDGDGKPDAISLQWKEGDREFVLKVGSATLRGKAYETAVQGVTVIDIDSADKWKEVAVQMGEVESDIESTVYGFDGKTLKELGTVRSLTEVRGNGIILSDTWMGFWNRREKYLLDRKAWKLNRVPQDFYYVGIEATVKQSFPLMRSRTDKAVVANLAQGSKILVLASEPVGSDITHLWYLVKSSTGLMGWARSQDLAEKSEGLPFAG